MAAHHYPYHVQSTSGRTFPSWDSTNGRSTNRPSGTGASCRPEPQYGGRNACSRANSTQISSGIRQPERGSGPADTASKDAVSQPLRHSSGNQADEAWTSRPKHGSVPVDHFRNGSGPDTTVDREVTGSAESAELGKCLSKLSLFDVIRATTRLLEARQSESGDIVGLYDDLNSALDRGGLKVVPTAFIESSHDSMDVYRDQMEKLQSENDELRSSLDALTEKYGMSQKKLFDNRRKILGLEEEVESWVSEAKRMKKAVKEREEALNSLADMGLSKYVSSCA